VTSLCLFICEKWCKCTIKKYNKQKNWKVTGDLHPDLDPLVKGMDPRIRIRTKISCIRNTGFHFTFLAEFQRKTSSICQMYWYRSSVFRIRIQAVPEFVFISGSVFLWLKKKVWLKAVIYVFLNPTKIFWLQKPPAQHRTLQTWNFFSFYSFWSILACLDPDPKHCLFLGTGTDIFYLYN
jgi:hypothetical protein